MQVVCVTEKFASVYHKDPAVHNQRRRENAIPSALQPGEGAKQSFTVAVVDIVSIN